MSTDRELEELLRRTLADEAPRMSPDLHEAVRSEVAETRQVAPGTVDFQTRWRGRSSIAVLAAAAVVVVAIGGLAVIDRLGLLGPGSTAEPGTSRSASASPGNTATAPTASSSAPPDSADPFQGRWSTLDIDGSQLTVVFGGTGSTRSVTWTDFRATTCAGGRAAAAGSGTVDGASIRVTMTGGCDGQPAGSPSNSAYTYDAASGTLLSTVDSLTWSRGAIPLDAFTGAWVATDIDGTSLRLTFDGTAGLEREVAYHDDHAQFCPAVPGYSATGPGSIGSLPGDGRFLRVTLVGSCDDGSSPRQWEHKYEFDVATGTLIGPLVPLDVGGTRGIETVVWSRP